MVILTKKIIFKYTKKKEWKISEKDFYQQRDKVTKKVFL